MKALLLVYLVMALALGIPAYALSKQESKTAVGTYQLACAGAGANYATHSFRCWRINTITGEVVQVVSQ